MEWLAQSGLGRVAADVVALTHAGWILFLLGGVLLARRTLLRVIHLGGLVVNVGLDLAGLDCPLTTLERALRRRFDPGGWYGGPFLQYYLGERIGLTLPSPLIRWLGIGLLVGTWALYRSRARAAQVALRSPWGDRARGSQTAGGITVTPVEGRMPYSQERRDGVSGSLPGAES